MPDLSPPSPPLRVRLGAVIRRRRIAAGYSQEGFADRVGVHRTFMSTVERGHSNVSLETLERIAAGLGARAGDLLLEAERAGDEPDVMNPTGARPEAGDPIEGVGRAAPTTPSEVAPSGTTAAEGDPP